MSIFLYLTFLFMGWNPLLCSPMTNYRYFFGLYVFHAVLLTLILEVNSLIDEPKANAYNWIDAHNERNWLCAPFAFLVVWALAGDHLCALFSLSFNTQVFISCLIVMIDLVMYFGMKEYNNNANLKGDYMKISSKVVKNKNELVSAHNSLVKYCKNLSSKVDKNWDELVSAHNTLVKYCETLNNNYKNLSPVKNKVEGLTVSQSALKRNLNELDSGLIDVMIDRIDLNERRYELLMKPLAECPFFQKNTRIFNALRNGEILSVFHLCQYSRSDLFKIKGLGIRSINDIENFMNLHDLCLGFDVFAVVRRHDFISRIIKQP